MDLSTTYLGLKLAHPFMPGASPMVDDLSTVRRLEDAGAAAIVMHSLFEEQITIERNGTLNYLDAHSETHAESLSYFPTRDEFRLGPEQYLEQLHSIKKAVSVPVIGSLNGITAEGWLKYAQLIQQSGADALEMNVYYLATDPSETGATVERRLLEVVRAVKDIVTIPIAVKLSPFYSSLAHLARQLDDQGVSGMVLFNRFYQPDMDVENLNVSPTLHLSDSSELLLRLRWLATLSGRVRASLAASGGVHTVLDAIKAIMAGAHAVQLVSSLLELGPEHLRTIREGAAIWMEEHEYASLAQMRGSMNQQRCSNPAAFERASYMRVLHDWNM